MAFLITKRELINENRAGSKSRKDAMQLYVQKFPNANEEQANDFIYKLKNDFPQLKDTHGEKFTYGVAQMFLSGEITNAKIINELRQTLDIIIKNKNYFTKYNQNLNGLSAIDLISEFKPIRQKMLKKDQKEASKQQHAINNSYKVVPINSFEEAAKYGKYNDWCLTEIDGERSYNSYTCNGANQLYFILKDGFENVPKQIGKNTPYDEYGLSMMTVIVDENGAMTQSTTRWNHENGSNDNILTTKQISELIGRNFYDVFKPNHKFKDAVENALQRVRNGEALKDVFKFVLPSNVEGIARVFLLGKGNFINTKGELLSPNQWFDEEAEFYEGYASVNVNGKCNFINTKGELLSPNQWFDDTWDFHGGFAKVKLNGEEHKIDTNGNIVESINQKDLISQLVESVMKKYSNISSQRKRKTIIMSEAMFDAYVAYLAESEVCYPDPEKVLIVKNYLDKNFAKATIDDTSADGYPMSIPVVGMKDASGNPVRNLNATQLFDILQDKFQDIISSREERDKFLKQVIQDWYSDNISKDGELSIVMVS